MGKRRSGDLSSRRAADQLSRIYFKYHGLCQICWNFCAYKDASREHVIPLWQGGTSDDDNIVLAHKRCNEGKNLIITGIWGTIRRQKNGYHVVAQRRDSDSPFAPFAPYSNIEDKP